MLFVFLAKAFFSDWLHTLAIQWSRILEELQLIIYNHTEYLNLYPQKGQGR